MKNFKKALIINLACFLLLSVNKAYSVDVFEEEGVHSKGISRHVKSNPHIDEKHLEFHEVELHVNQKSERKSLFIWDWDVFNNILTIIHNHFSYLPQYPMFLQV